MTQYYRPILQTKSNCAPDAVQFGQSHLWFSHVEVLSRNASPVISHIHDIDPQDLAPLLQIREPIAGITFDRPNIMGILNVTPDSFSDGGQNNDPTRAISTAHAMVAEGADIIDIGGESTRPGADLVPVDVEIERTQPVISELSKLINTPISLDTRKAKVAVAGLDAGAGIINDVSGFTFDSELSAVCAAKKIPVCVMHAQGDPKTMQDNPCYDNVVLDVYDFLQRQIKTLNAAGVPKSQIIADPGIGFGKTLEHNLELLNKIAIFHGLGVPILLGVSRKGMIRTIGRADNAQDRAPGSMAVALHAWSQGVQIFRVHDVAQTKQAFDLWRAVELGGWDGT